tara:strand:- start:2578 stop:2931 length:354 start_codon:yes stop_codon:yes gene_type:complete
MDLIKMHPMARKMNSHNEGLNKAIEDGNTDAARLHLTEILKYASTLEDDLLIAIRKSEDTVVTPDNGWQQQSPVIKYNETGAKFDPTQRDRQLPGTIMSARSNPSMKKARSTFGRRV